MLTSAALLLYGSAFVTAIISGSLGMVGGVMLLAMMSVVLPYAVVVPLHGIVQLASNSSRVFFLWQQVSWQIFSRFAFGLPLGALGAYQLLLRLPDPQWCIIAVVVLLLYVGLKPPKLPDITLGPWGFFGIGIGAGLLGPLLGATGPLLAPFFVRRDFPKEQIIATQSACLMVVHLIKIPVFLALDFSYSDHFAVLAGMILAVVLGTRVGTKVLQRISPARFMMLLRLSMVLIACKLLWGLQ